MPYRIKISNGVEEIEIKSGDISHIDTMIQKVEQLKKLLTKKPNIDSPKEEEESYLGKS